MNCSLREAMNDDFTDVYNLLCELVGAPIGQLSSERLNEIYNTNLQLSCKAQYVAELSGEIVGFVSITFDFRLSEAGKIALIDELVVKEACRGNGIGSALLNHVVKLAKVADCCLLEVSTNFRRVDAHRFYQKNGFSQNGYRFGLSGIES